MFFDVRCDFLNRQWLRESNRNLLHRCREACFRFSDSWIEQPDWSKVCTAKFIALKAKLFDQRDFEVGFQCSTCLILSKP